MTRVINVRSSLSLKKNDKLPELQRNKIKIQKSSPEEINEIKLKIQQMESEIRQLKAKTSRMRQLLFEKNNAIKQVFSQSNDTPNIKTTSETTISQLKNNVNSLKNTLESRKEELILLKNSDKLAISEELHLEIKEYYLEHQRLTQQVNAVKEGEKIINDEHLRLKNLISQSNQNEEIIKDLQKDIDQIIEKIIAYKKSELKIESTNLIQFIVDNPKHIEIKEKELQEEIDNIYIEIEQEKEAIKVLEENDEKFMSFLQGIIDDQSKKIQELLILYKEKN